MKCVLLFYIIYQIMFLLSDNGNNDLIIRQHFTNLSTVKELSPSIHLNETKLLEVNTSTIRIHEEVCFDNSTNSIYKNMMKTIDLSTVESVSKLYVEIPTNLSCYSMGTDINKTSRQLLGYCLCLEYYYGPNCDIPAAVWHSIPLNLLNTSIKVRKVTKKVINGFLFNHEFDMLEARLHELADVVDVFVILECSFTSFGVKKPLRLYERFVKGYMKEFSHKIIHVFMDIIPNFKYFQGHNVDRLLRCYLSRQGLARIKGTLEDDLFILSDADEILSADVVSFLKIYDGLTPVVDLTYKWNMFGFFWKNDLTTNIVSVSTLKHLRKELNYYANAPRNDRTEKFYMKIGTTSFWAGWHCSWCFSPEGIALKMISAHGADPPRLGDDPTKRNLTFIKECIKQGRYFYEAPPLIRCHKDSYMYAPKYLMEHAEKYKTILEHPDEQRD